MSPRAAGTQLSYVLESVELFEHLDLYFDSLSMSLRYIKAHTILESLTDLENAEARVKDIHRVAACNYL